MFKTVAFLVLLALAVAEPEPGHISAGYGYAAPYAPVTRTVSSFSQYHPAPVISSYAAAPVAVHRPVAYAAPAHIHRPVVSAYAAPAHIHRPVVSAYAGPVVSAYSAPSHRSFVTGFSTRLANPAVAVHRPIVSTYHAAHSPVVSAYHGAPALAYGGHYGKYY